jgi:MFS family permease
VRNTTGCAFFGVGTIIGLTILVPLYLKMGLGLTATLSGVAVIALQGGATIASIVATYMIVRTVRYRRIPLAGVAVAVAFLAVLVVEPTRLSLPVLVVVITLIGAGLGPLFPMSIITIQNVIAPRQLGIATGVSGFFRSLGGTFIVAAFGAIVLGGAQEVAGGATVDPNVFRWVFAAAIGCLLATIAFLFGIEERPWRGPGELVSNDD